MEFKPAFKTTEIIEIDSDDDSDTKHNKKSQYKGQLNLAKTDERKLKAILVKEITKNTVYVKDPVYFKVMINL